MSTTESDMTIEAELISRLRSASVYNPEVQVAPACVLWPDKGRQWEAVIPIIQSKMPELLALGDYASEHKAGPAIWLRCVLAGVVDDVDIPDDLTPILYLPGVGRSDLRAVDSCPNELKPLAELQYRGSIWSQSNGKDWTVFAFLKAEDGGLGLNVAADEQSRRGMVLALHKLLEEDIRLIEEKNLERDYFNKLLTGGDPVRDVLQWLNQGDAFRASRSDSEWSAFVQVCRSELGLDPSSDSVLTAATKLANRQGPWESVWARFCEAPNRYPNIADQIRRATPPEFDLFTDVVSGGGWPQWNDSKEKRLNSELRSLGDLAPHTVRERVHKLEVEHGERRGLIWAEVGEAPLAMALAHLARIADVTSTTLAAGGVTDVVKSYDNKAWQADDAVLRALECVGTTSDREAVVAVIRAIYRPWAEEAARYLQEHWDPSKDGVSLASPAAGVYDDHGPECVLFVDGLRFDCAKRLREMLESMALAVEERASWAALPSVTGTGKYAVAPILNGDNAGEDPDPADFTPITPHLFRKLLKDAGWQFLDRQAVLNLHNDANSEMNTWCEFGDLDHEGHERGWKLAKRVGDLLTEVRDRIQALLDAGWPRVRVVTDHGWLLLPGGLPKVELPAGVANTKWGRCAALKPGAQTAARLFPWYWDPAQHFALADGIACFKVNQEYAHGGLSLQECRTLELTVAKNPGEVKWEGLEFTDIIWTGLRCKIAVDSDIATEFGNLSADIRLRPADPNSSIVVAPKQLKANGTVSVVVEDEQFEGSDAEVIIMTKDGEIVAQSPTRIDSTD